ncbi:hypothetical protein [Salinicola sp. MH3R3-1]|uniref:hypothetical protein n=1 Tax=Salinicola sp. MH3R3-1 TaxID=1928762 RepID=UPI0009FA80CF|nr:hypothetical protein [Salinicola sp. MH3R3-1]
MMNWISQHSSAITALTSLCTLLVWLFYAQLLYLNFKRQRQPKIIINRGFGRSLQARCVISNMSPEPIFIEHIVVILHTDRGKLFQDLIDFERSAGDKGSADQLVETTRQGPMASGSYNHIGTFQNVVERVLRWHDIPTDDFQTTDGRTLQAVELRVIAIYGSEDSPVGASRTFELTMSPSGEALIPTRLDTRRYASRWRRLRVKRWIRELDA